MNEADKKTLVQALRSGDYKQTRGALCRRNPDTKKDTFCCLGVTIDVLLDKYWTLNPNGNNWYTTNFWRAGSLTTSELRTVGLSLSEQAHLIAMNDGGHSFKKIATWIEKNVRVDNES